MKDIHSSELINSFAQINFLMNFVFFREYLDYDITPSEERIHEIVDQLLVYLNCTLKRLRSVILVEDLIDSIKVNTKKKKSTKLSF